MSSSVSPTVQWLLDGDPTIRWQTLRDVLDAPAQTVNRERNNIVRDGWGARLLGEQDELGGWASKGSPDGGLYTPKWKSTTYTMLLLRDFGLPPSTPQIRQACALLLDRGLRNDGGINYGRHDESETCITGMVLSILSYFDYDDERVDIIARHLLAAQMPDGGWNCRRSRGATHASMHTTISVLESLYWYGRSRRRNARAIRAAQQRGREFLLAHRLFRSHRTGNIIKSDFTRFVFPPRWHYDILRALDHFRASDAPRDERLSEAVALVRARAAPDGRWPLTYSYWGQTYFTLERVGSPSRWNTLRALRVLKWWDSGITTNQKQPWH